VPAVAAGGTSLDGLRTALYCTAASTGVLKNPRTAMDAKNVFPSMSVS
jgi:hypothetical protein